MTRITGPTKKLLTKCRLTPEGVIQLSYDFHFTNLIQGKEN
jgi:hypothetical protein